MLGYRKAMMVGCGVSMLDTTRELQSQQILRKSGKQLEPQNHFIKENSFT